MKSSRKHTLSLYRFLVALCGIAFCSFVLPGSDSDENEFLYPDLLETEYSSIHSYQNPADEDSKHSNDFHDLIFKETVEEKVPSANTSGPAVLKQGVTHIEAALVKLTLDSPFLFRSPGNVSKAYTPDLKYKPALNFIVSLLPLAGGISINAP